MKVCGYQARIGRPENRKNNESPHIDDNNKVRVKITKQDSTKDYFGQSKDRLSLSPTLNEFGFKVNTQNAPDFASNNSDIQEHIA